MNDNTAPRCGMCGDVISADQSACKLSVFVEPYQPGTYELEIDAQALRAGKSAIAHQTCGERYYRLLTFRTDMPGFDSTMVLPDDSFRSVG